MRRIESAERIWAVFRRYCYLHRRSVVRSFDLFFWPVMELLLFGFLALYIRNVAPDSLGGVIFFLIGALISWDIHYRAQQAVTVPLLDELWTRNLIHLVISPLRLWEWIAATFFYGALKVGIITLILTGLAKALYAFDFWRVGWEFAPMAGGLLMFGWALGLFTSALLIRYGLAGEALIWGVPFLIQPFSCVFYPLSTLPAWAQPIARILPTTYAFEGLRAALRHEPVPSSTWIGLFGLGLVYFAAGVAVLVWMLRKARREGSLGSPGRH